MSGPRDFAAELAAARDAEDWEAHARIWEERSLAEVDADEAVLDSPARESDADARLRAAARDLLEALVITARILSSHGYETDYAKAAIVKAIGGAA